MKELCGSTYPPLGSANAWYAGKPSSFAPGRHGVLDFHSIANRYAPFHNLPVQKISMPTPFSSA